MAWASLKIQHERRTLEVPLCVGRSLVETFENSFLNWLREDEYPPSVAQRLEDGSRQSQRNILDGLRATRKEPNHFLFADVQHPDAYCDGFGAISVSCRERTFQTPFRFSRISLTRLRKIPSGCGGVSGGSWRKLEVSASKSTIICSEPSI